MKAEAPVRVWKYGPGRWTWECWHHRHPELVMGGYYLTQAEALAKAVEHCRGEW